MGVAGVYGQLRRLKLSANWVLMVAFAQPVAAPGALEGAVVQGCEVLSWAANNSAKLRLGGPAECWTLISSQAYGKANKVPQVCGRRRAGGSASASACLYAHAWHCMPADTTCSRRSPSESVPPLLLPCRRMCLLRWQSEWRPRCLQPLSAL